jgi:hypothetical protein
MKPGVVVFQRQPAVAGSDPVFISVKAAAAAATTGVLFSTLALAWGVPNGSRPQLMRKQPGVDGLVIVGPEQLVSSLMAVEDSSPLARWGLLVDDGQLEVFVKFLPPPALTPAAAVKGGGENGQGASGSGGRKSTAASKNSEPGASTVEQEGTALNSAGDAIRAVLKVCAPCHIYNTDNPAQVFSADNRHVKVPATMPNFNVYVYKVRGLQLCVLSFKTARMHRSSSYGQRSSCMR